MNRTQFVEMLRDTLVHAASLNIGDIVLNLSTGREGEVVRFDSDGDPILKTSDGDSSYINSNSWVLRIFSVNDAVRVFLPTNASKELLQSNENLSDIRGYLTVYVEDEDSRQRLFEIHSEREHLITELTVRKELPSVNKLKKKHRRALALVAGHYSPGEESKEFFNSFMSEIL